MCCIAEGRPLLLLLLSIGVEGTSTLEQRCPLQAAEGHGNDNISHNNNDYNYNFILFHLLNI